MILRPPSSTRTDPLFPYTTLFRSPRRLLLDFSDIFGDGLGFNSLRGHFDIADGQARTDDLLVQAAAAEIRVRGRAGLVAQDYDQMVDVRPKAGSVFPAVGALARSEERRVGKECVSTCRSRWSPSH